MTVAELALQVSRAQSVEHLNVGGTFITDVSILAIAAHCSRLKVCNLFLCTCRNISSNKVMPRTLV